MARVLARLIRILEQSVEGLKRKGKLTAHMEGMLAAYPGMIPLALASRLLMQPHTVRMSVLLRAAAEIDLRLLQQSSDGRVRGP
jgi:hypothetical protein